MAKAKGNVEILYEYCKGCGLCVGVCPTGNLKISDTLSPLGVNPTEAKNPQECTLCRRCTIMCPDGAIRLSRLTDETPENPPTEAETEAEENSDA